MKDCRHRIVVEDRSRSVNALHIDVMSPMPRCRLRPPDNWPDDGRDYVFRWLMSGGSPLVLGRCNPRCCPARENKSEK